MDPMWCDADAALAGTPAFPAAANSSAAELQLQAAVTAYVGCANGASGRA
jgi:hypothetical protein